MNWTQHKALYDLWGSFEKRLHEKNDAPALAAWQSLSLSSPSKEWLQSLSKFCAQSVSEEMLFDCIAHSWNALGEALCSQRDWVLEGTKNPKTEQVDEALWTILAQSARATLQLVSDQQLEKMFDAVGVTAEQLLELMVPPSALFDSFLKTVQHLRTNSLTQTPSVVYSATNFPWQQLDHVSDQIIAITGVGVGVDPQSLNQALQETTKIVEGLRSTLAPTELSQMNWATVNYIKRPLNRLPVGKHSAEANTIDLYVSEDGSAPILDVFAHEWGHALEFQVGHSNCTIFSDPRLSSVQAPLEQLVTAIFNTPQCPISAKILRESATDEIIHDVTTYLKNLTIPVPTAQALAPAVWENYLRNQSVVSVLNAAGVSDTTSVETYVKSLGDIHANFNQQLAEGKSVWISYSAFTDSLTQLNGQSQLKSGYWSDPREIFARAMEAALPHVLNLGPKTPRHGMYPHHGEFTYICEQVQTFLSSLPHTTTLSDKIVKKRGSAMVDMKSLMQM